MSAKSLWRRFRRDCSGLSSLQSAMSIHLAGSAEFNGPDKHALDTQILLIPSNTKLLFAAQELPHRVGSAELRPVLLICQS